jgi:hypothetical protein
MEEQQRVMISTGDVQGFDRVAHRNLRINAPNGRILTREQFLASLKSGEIAAERFERTPEDVHISGNIAVVMGREVYTPVASSEGGRLFGARPLQRRYTNVYIWEQGRWQWVARHANNVAPPSSN